MEKVTKNFGLSILNCKGIIEALTDPWPKCINIFERISLNRDEFDQQLLEDTDNAKQLEILMRSYFMESHMDLNGYSLSLYHKSHYRWDYSINKPVRI